jgi:hypothetical protein
MTKPDEVSVSINGEEIKGTDNTAYEFKPCTITIDRYFDHIEVNVKDFQGNEMIGGQKRIDILKDTLIKIQESLQS